MLIKAYRKSNIRGKNTFMYLQYFYGMCSITGVEFFILVSNMKGRIFLASKRNFETVTRLE